MSGGPGSFTGLRLGITVARTLAWAGRSRQVRCVRVPTLDVIAQNALDETEPPTNLVVLLDAKRQRVYAAAFVLADGGYQRVTEPAERSVAELAATLPAGCAAIGEGIPYHQPAVDRAGLTVLPEGLNRARAEVVHRLGYARARGRAVRRAQGLCSHLHTATRSRGSLGASLRGNPAPPVRRAGRGAERSQRPVEEPCGDGLSSLSNRLESRSHTS